ncbi:MAG: nucleotidyltransferase domain-containing protein [Terriglobia bacterium]|jgi:predicted nucleotidyltransferase
MTDEMNRLADKSVSAREAAGAKEVRVFGSGSMNAPSDDLVGDIVRRIVETAQPDKIILFGSRARGDARPNSDFDILVIKESSEPRYRRSVPLYVALADVPAEVEVVVYTPEEIDEWRQVSQAFVTTAVREGTTIYERPSRT